MIPSLLLIGALAPAFAQGADEPWSTLETAHFRLHTPDVALPWALEIAARLEEIRARVSAEVGPAPDEVVDIVLMDPARSPNGFAIPLANSPRMGLFPTAPTAGGGLANYRSWAEDLVVHEDGHLVHLLRPSRSPIWRATLSPLGLEPNLDQPIWVIEGYATLIEGRLSGRGRPHGDERAAWLRVLAQDGRLPSYEGLSGGEGFMGRSHPYFVGSAFLEWLEVRACQPTTDVPAPGACPALPALWARATARTLRSFDDAFVGVFGEPPATLYARFQAELSHAALQQESARPVDESLWLDLHGASGDLAISPDGGRLALVRREKGRSRLVVYATEDDPEALDRWLEPHRKAAERDPDDVIAVVPPTLPREPLAWREDPFRPSAHPAWMPDGSAVLLTVYQQDLRGQLRPDLFRWDPETGLERALTEGADLSQAYPFPDGQQAIALRRRWGVEELVRVDLSSGAVEAIAAFPVGVVLDRPRVDPSGRTLAYLRHEGRWSLVLRDLQTGEERLPALPEEAGIADLQWSPDGRSLLFALGAQGYIEIHRLHLEGGGLEDGQLERLSTSRGAATNPVLSPDGQTLFHLGLDSDGVDVHRLAVLPHEASVPAAPPPLRPPVHPDPPGEIPADPASLRARPYGLGQPEALPLLGGSVSPEGPAAELGVRVGDVIGRHELLLLGGFGDTQGTALGLSWRGPPAAEGQSARFEAAWLQDSPMGGLSGAALSLEQSRSGPRTRWEVLLGGTALGRPQEAVSMAARVEAMGARRFGRTGWFEPLGRLRLLVGAPDQRALHTELGLRAGYRAFLLDGLYHRGLAGEGFSLGGAESSLLPSSLRATWLPEPWLNMGELSGEALEHHRWTLGVETIGLYGARYLLDGHASTAAGLRAGAILAARPMVRLPAIDLDLGVVCRVETPAGVDLKACGALDGWAAWARLGWRL